MDNIVFPQTVFLVLSRKSRWCYAVCSSYRIALQQKRRCEEFFEMSFIIEEKYLQSSLDRPLW